VLRLMEVQERRASRSSRFMKNEFDRKSNKRRNEFSTTRLKKKKQHYFNYNNNISIIKYSDSTKT